MRGAGSRRHDFRKTKHLETRETRAHSDAAGEAVPFPHIKRLIGGEKSAQADDFVHVTNDATLHRVVLGAGDLIEAFVVALAGVILDALVGQQGWNKRNDEHQIRRSHAAQMLRPPTISSISRQTQGSFLCCFVGGRIG